MFRKVLRLVGRAMLCTIFISSALMNNIPNFDAVVERMKAQGIPQAKLMLIGAIILMLFGSLLVITGIGARWGALMLLIFLAAATYFFHDFWTIEPSAKVVAQVTAADARVNEMIHFLKNLAIGGALVMILASRRSHRFEELDDSYLD